MVSTELFVNVLTMILNSQNVNSFFICFSEPESLNDTWPQWTTENSLYISKHLINLNFSMYVLWGNCNTTKYINGKTLYYIYAIICMYTAFSDVMCMWGCRRNIRIYFFILKIQINVPTTSVKQVSLSPWGESGVWLWNVQDHEELVYSWPPCCWQIRATLDASARGLYVPAAAMMQATVMDVSCFTISYQWVCAPQRLRCRRQILKTLKITWLQEWNCLINNGRY